jgi:2-polyprenyl-6-methoxyphenol hydroxylase-like FAD-dependent oxidoreductase
MTARPTYDAIIVGARVAGAATAMLLARSGLRVLVVDQRRRGSDTLSTHALMRGGVIQLSRWGLLDEVRAAGTPPVHRTVVRYGDDEEIVTLKPIPHCDALYAPRRTVLDDLLVAAAERAGAEVRFGVRVTGLLRSDDGRVRGAVVRDPDGRCQELQARITIGADGIRSGVARDVGAVTYGLSEHTSALVHCYLDGLEVDGYHWLYGTTTSAGLIPTNDGLVCAWLSAPSTSFARLRAGGDPGFRATFASVAPDLADAVRRARRVGPLRGFVGSPGYLRHPWGRGWALVGDASHFKDPLSAHGMTDALRDAELLADAVLTAAADERQEAAALAGYHDLRDELSRDLHALVDRAAAYDWTMAELRELLVALSAAMRVEVAHLLARDPLPVAA